MKGCIGFWCRETRISWRGGAQETSVSPFEQKTVVSRVLVMVTTRRQSQEDLVPKAERCRLVLSRRNFIHRDAKTEFGPLPEPRRGEYLRHSERERGGISPLGPQSIRFWGPTEEDKSVTMCIHSQLRRCRICLPDTRAGLVAWLGCTIWHNDPWVCGQLPIAESPIWGPYAIFWRRQCQVHWNMRPGIHLRWLPDPAPDLPSPACPPPPQTGSQWRRDPAPLLPCPKPAGPCWRRDPAPFLPAPAGPPPPLFDCKQEDIDVKKEEASAKQEQSEESTS